MCVKGGNKFLLFFFGAKEGPGESHIPSSERPLQSTAISARFFIGHKKRKKELKKIPPI